MIYHCGVLNNNKDPVCKDKMDETVDISSHLLDEARSVIHDPAHLGVLPCESRHGGIYPKVDLAIWLRSCIKEVSVPIEGQVRGTIPHWITGDFLQNGPGVNFNHLLWLLYVKTAVLNLFVFTYP